MKLAGRTHSQSYLKGAQQLATCASESQPDCTSGWKPHRLAVANAADGRIKSSRLAGLLNSCQGSADRVWNGRRAPTLKAVRRAATTCSEQLVSCEHVE